jgi:Mg-chelatase subunit ChlD
MGLAVFYVVVAFSVVLGETAKADTIDVVAQKLNQKFFSYFSETSSRLVSPLGSSNLQTRVQGLRNVDPNKVDLLFVMDNSGSIGRDNFVKQKQFVNLIIDHSLTVTCNRSTRIALISFADISQITIEFDFDDHSTSATPRADLKNAVNAIAYVNGDATNTAGALKEARSLFDDPSRGGRSDANRIIFVITDGRSNQGRPPGPEADILRKTDGAIIFVMGVANFDSVDSQTELRAIASDPEHDEERVLVVDDFDDMTAIAARFGARKSENSQKSTRLYRLFFVLHRT